MKRAMCCLMPALMIGVLMLTGCASSGSTRSQPQGPVAPESMSVAMPEVDGKPVLKAESKADFDALIAAIRQQMLPRGRWQYVHEDERATLDRTFNDMTKLYAEFGSVAKMDKQARALLAIDQHIVDPILAKRDGNRLVCRRIARVGTHLPTKTCMTYSEVQALRHNMVEHTQEFYRHRNQVPNTRSGPGGG